MMSKQVYLFRQEMMEKFKHSINDLILATQFLNIQGANKLIKGFLSSAFNDQKISNDKLSLEPSHKQMSTHPTQNSCPKL